METTIDGHLARIQLNPKVATFAFHNPTIAWQRGSFSDIQRGHRDYSEAMKAPDNSH
jgi:hypothetical protein